MLKKSVATAGVSLLFFAGPVLAQTFDEVCPAMTTAHHPEIDAPVEACACIKEEADDAILTELTEATSPDQLSEETKAVMRECGYDV